MIPRHNNPLKFNGYKKHTYLRHYLQIGLVFVILFAGNQVLLLHEPLLLPEIRA